MPTGSVRDHARVRAPREYLIDFNNEANEANAASRLGREAVQIKPGQVTRNGGQKVDRRRASWCISEKTWKSVSDSRGIQIGNSAVNVVFAPHCGHGR